MSTYQRGKIYKITSNQTDKIYIGSSCEKYLSNRIAKHNTGYRAHLKGKHNYVSSYEIIKFDDAQIELIERYPCETKEELFARESFHIRDNKDIAVNICIPARTAKEYRDENKDKINRYNKKYKDLHKEELKIKQKLYVNKNKENVMKWKRESYARNKSKVANNRKAKYMCICGTEPKKYDKGRHEKSTFHTEYIEKEQSFERQCQNALRDVFD